ncbi:MAG: TonB-dependent receptor, partial [Candidatus Marinimicrobia bacterium]|nr:TonB-dependent receptor [Candidatus Neomarinimicrobiota bacterium]
TASGKSIKIDDEINYFPDLHFTYNLTEKKSIQFGLSKRIERPGGGGHGKGWGQLRPFPRSVYNDSFIMVGFPTLKPEFSTQYDLSYKSPMPMGFYYTNLYYRKIENSIEWYDYDGIDGQFSGNAVTFKNAEGGTDIGLELFMMIMGQTVGGGYNINELKDSSNDYQLNGKNERINMYMRINLPEEYIKFFSYEFGFYYMKLKVPGGTLFGAKGTLWANTGISKSLFDDMATISFSIDNIFDKGGFQMDRTKPLIDSDIEIGKEHTEILASRGGRTFSLSVKYNFGKMQEEKRRGRGKGFGGDSMDMGY